ncbi:hypothetical protein ACROYT_G008906 [Oculina patagonica]
MASSSAGKQQNWKSRKRKRNSDIPGFAPTKASTPLQPSLNSTAVISQAPRAINAEQFASARAVEIKNMVAAIEEAGSLKGKRVFQTLPRHMRRRAMSHNVKRMPVRLRQRASFEMHNTANKPETPKKKSRHHRRQPKNLLEEYTRRQRKHVWLETHIWHAKRMKMIDAWGYRLADHPNDKGFRAAYRAAKNNCILQDMSYYGCIEVTGVQSQIIQAIRHLTSQETGLTIAAKHYLNGTREGNVMLYKFDQFPCGAISPVSFLWRQMVTTETTNASENVQHTDKHQMEQQNVENDGITQDQTLLKASHKIREKEEISQLWIWSHPASFDSVFDAITEACNSVGRTLVKKDSKFPDAVDKDSIVVQEQPDQGTQSIPLVNGTNYSELKVASRQYDLLRLRLTGPQSHALLTNTLKLSTDLKHKESESKSDTNALLKESTTFFNDKRINNSSAKWWQKSLDNPKDFLAQAAIWDKLKKASSPAVLPPGCVIGLTVLDPRLYLPGKKKSITSTTEDISSDESDLCDETVPPSNDIMNSTDKATSKAEKEKPSFEHVISHWPSDVAGSHIWDQSVRREVKETKVSEQELNRRRSELLVPGSQLDLNPDEISHIPVLLIQQAGCSGASRNTGVGAGYGSGWDIILPSGWAMAFWIAFVYRGARTGALQESQTLALEQGVLFFPNDFPDTPAGEAHNKKLKEDGEAKYKRYPPAKRPNYDKLGARSPFSPPWRELVKDWSTCEAASSHSAMEIATRLLVI